MRVRTFAFATVLCCFCVYCEETVGGTFAGDATLADGASCSKSADCLSFNCVSGRCAPTPGKSDIDQTCGSDGDCVADATCQDGVCIEICAGQGEMCTESSDCCGGLPCGEDFTCGGSNPFGTGGGTPIGNGGSSSVGTGGSGGGSSCISSGLACDPNNDLCCTFCNSGVCD
jgi:hypothetical protein